MEEIRVLFLFSVVLTLISGSDSKHLIEKRITENHHHNRRDDADSIFPDKFPQFPDYDLNEVPKPIVNWKHTWPDGIIYYHISHKFDNDSRAIIHSAMDEIRGKTCIRFKERSDEPDYVYFKQVLGDGCYSSTGRHEGRQILNLDPRKCIQHGKIVHELLHSTGFHHEHQRADRDEHIEILWDNIKDEAKDQFQILSAPDEYLKEIPYDCESVLHYGPVSFFLAIDIDKPVLKAKGFQPNLGQRVGMSELDAKKLNLLYNCNK